MDIIPEVTTISPSEPHCADTTHALDQNTQPFCPEISPHSDHQCPSERPITDSDRNDGGRKVLSLANRFLDVKQVNQEERRTVNNTPGFEDLMKRHIKERGRAVKSS